MGLRSANSLGLAGAAHDAKAQKKPAHALAHGPTVVDGAGEPN
jgi:hypothetical protein